jgi:hypothetical protein
MDWYSTFMKALGGIITTRTSIFTPLITFNTIIIGFSVLIYYKNSNLWVFAPSVLLLLYSIYRHERFAQEMPHMLSTETIQKIGMNLKMGNNKAVKSEASIDAMQPIKNPEIVNGEIISSQPGKERKNKNAS